MVIPAVIQNPLPAGAGYLSAASTTWQPFADRNRCLRFAKRRERYDDNDVWRFDGN